MPLIFAFVVAAQIHTGADLLAACQQRDTTACDAFIEAQLRSSPEFGCSKLPKTVADRAEWRRGFLWNAAAWRDYPGDQPAAEFFANVMGPDCSAE